MSKQPRGYVPGEDRIRRGLRWVAYGVGAASDLDLDPRTVAYPTADVIDFSSPLQLLSMRVPAPPSGYGLLCESVVDLNWTATDSLEAWLTMQAGSSVLATAFCYVPSTTGSLSVSLGGLYEGGSEAFYTLTLENAGGISTAHLHNAYMKAVFTKYTWQDIADYSGTIPSTAPESADYYVSTTGDDANSGGWSDPFLTIQKGVDVATSGEKILVLAGTYNEDVTITADGIWIKGYNTPSLVGTGDFAVYSTVANSVTLQGLDISGASSAGVYLWGTDSTTRLSSWQIKDCRIHNIPVRGISLGYTESFQIDGNVIHHIEYDGESFGIKCDRSLSAEIVNNEFYMCRKSAIRTIRSTATVMQNNIAWCCWTAYEVNEADRAALIENNEAHHCTIGVYPKHTYNNDATAYTIIRHNTLIDCADACVEFGSNGSAGDYVEVTYNLFKQPNGLQFVYCNDDYWGSYLTIDYNMYWSLGTGPHHYLEIDPGSRRSYSVADIQATTAYEVNGLEYNSADAANYGASALSQVEPDWVRATAASIYDASSNTAGASKTLDWRTGYVWDAVDATDEWVAYDLGTVFGVDHVLMQPWGDKKDWNPQNIRIEYSADGTSWSTAMTHANDYRGALWPYDLGATIEARYWRFWIEDAFGNATTRFDNIDFGRLE